MAFVSFLNTQACHKGFLGFDEYKSGPAEYGPAGPLPPTTKAAVDHYFPGPILVPNPPLVITVISTV